MKVNINGRDKVFFESWLGLSYEQLCEMAGVDEKHNPSIIYKHARYPADTGTLIPGQSVTVQHGTIINVVITGAA
jgi:hypothetical protein